MDIAFLDVTATVSYGGIQTAIWELATALHDQGHRITVYGGAGPVEPDLGGRDIRICRFPFTPRQRFPNLGTRFKKLAERWSFSRQARATVGQANHDWVVLTKPLDFFWPKLMPAASTTRFAFMSGGTDYFPGDRYFARDISAWLACSHFNGWQISSHYKTYPKVMYNGVGVEKFHPDRRDLALRQQLGVADGETLFAFAGRLAGWKGLSVAIRALADAQMAKHAAKLLIIGQGDALPGLRQLADSLGVASRVIFQAPIPHAQLPRWYASADGGIFPSLGDEAFGITIAEAMACGLPPIASYNGGIPEVVGNEGSAGVLCGLGDVSAFAAAMAAFCADPVKRQALGRAARERIVAHFTWTMAAERMLAALQ